MPTKISNFPTSSNPALNDLIPIIDVSETNTINQNKKVTVETLLNLNAGNPYLQTNLTGTIRLRRTTTAQSLTTNTFTIVLFNQAILSSTGVAIGSFNTSTGELTLNSTGTYNFTGYLTFNNGVVGTRTIFYADNPTTGSFDNNTRLESAIISQAVGSFILPINFNLKIVTAPTTFTFISASSTSVAIAQANSTLSTYAESQITVVKLS